MQDNLGTEPGLIKLVGGVIVVAIAAAAVFYQIRNLSALPDSYRSALGSSDSSDGSPGLAWCRSLSDGEPTAFGVFDFVNPGPDALIVESLSWNIEVFEGNAMTDIEVQPWAMTTPDHDDVLPTGVMSLKDIAASPIVKQGWEIRSEVPTQVPPNWRAGVVLLIQHPAGTSVAVTDIEMSVEVAGAGGNVASGVTIESGSICE